MLTLLPIIENKHKGATLERQKRKHSPLPPSKLKQVFTKNNNYVTIFRNHIKKFLVNSSNSHK